MKLYQFTIFRRRGLLMNGPSIYFMLSNVVFWWSDCLSLLTTEFMDGPKVKYVRCWLYSNKDVQILNLKFNGQIAVFNFIIVQLTFSIFFKPVISEDSLGSDMRIPFSLKSWRATKKIMKYVCNAIITGSLVYSQHLCRQF